MDELEEQISLYEAIIEVNYEYWITENELDVAVSYTHLTLPTKA